MAAKKNISSKYEEYCISSNIISKGPPVIYKMITETKSVGTIEIKTVGKQHFNKTNRTILLVGESGAGKSTLINAIINYSMGVTFEDKVWFQIIDKDSIQTESQTKDVTVYQIFGFEGETLPFSLTIIDTPGFGNTEGIHKDVIVSQMLFDLFRSEHGVQEINVVGLVMKVSDCRLHPQLMYVLDSVMSLFGKDLEKSIVPLFTYSNGTKPKNALKILQEFGVKWVSDDQSLSKLFLFDNCQEEERTYDEEDLKHSNKTTSRSMKQFGDFLEATTPVRLSNTQQVLCDRIRLVACVQNLQEKIRFLDQMKKKFQQHEKTLKENEEQIKKNENVQVEAAVIQRIKKNIEGGKWMYFFHKGAVTCEQCKENCHYPGCTVAKSPKKCEVMRKGICTVCNCPVAKHVKDNFIYVTETINNKINVHDLKNKYDKGEDYLPNLKKKLEKVESEQRNLIDEAYTIIVQLEEIALNVKAASTHLYLDFLIDKIKETGDTTKVKKLEHIKKREDKQIQAVLKYISETDQKTREE